MSANVDAVEVDKTAPVQKAAPVMRETKPVAPSKAATGTKLPAASINPNVTLPANLRVTAQLPSTNDPRWLRWAWTVENVGGDDAPASTLKIVCQPIKGTCPDYLTGTYPVPPLAKLHGKYVFKKETDYRNGMNPVQEGLQSTVEIKFYATADSTNVVTESNENDNVNIATWKSVVDVKQSTRLTLKPNVASNLKDSPFSPNPDLTLALEPGKSFTAGQPVWVLVKNVGDRPADFSSVEIHCWDDAVETYSAQNLCAKVTGYKVNLTTSKFDGKQHYNGTIYLGKIDAGSFEAAVQLTPVAYPKPYRIEMKVEGSGSQREKSYSNNTLVVTHP